MAEDMKLDEETQKFYDENKEMIDRILAGRSASTERDPEKGYLEEMVRRAAFERKMRLEYEAEKARRDAFDKADEAYEDFRYSRSRTEAALEESRDHAREYARRQGDYFFDMIMEEADHVRDNARRRRQYLRDHYEADREDLRESRDRLRQIFNDGFDDVFGPLTDSRFQKHMFGAGLEFWMAINALVKSAPFPESVKEAFSAADANKNAEFCRKNEYCRKNSSEETGEPAKPSEPQQITIRSLKKEDQ